MKKLTGKFRALIALLTALALAALLCVVNARMVRLKNLEYQINDLDSRLDGTRIMFVSDLKISSVADAKRCASLINRLAASKPDILIIGGDLTSKPSGEMSGGQYDVAYTALEESLAVFFSRTSGISLPGGCYIVYGDSDILIPDSYLRMSAFRLLNGAQVKVYLNGASLVLAGYDGLSPNPRTYRFNDEGTGLCIVTSHNPSAAKLVPYITDRYGNPYCDLLLTGHTLGGQVKIAGKSLFYGDENLQYPDETFTALTIPVVSSRGIGTETLPVRIGAAPSAYMITLVK